LNTSLLVFLLAHRKGFLGHLVRKVRDNSLIVNGDITEGGDPVVFENYRRLLWYWQEYYLRRGRDRLSLEFSSHIHFHLWNEVVEHLTRDDGSETALLSAPIILPKSPYAISPHPVSSTSEYIQNYSKPKYRVTDCASYFDEVD
jgi:hypothetical protein